MEAHEALERFETVHEGGHGAGIARAAALTVAIVAAFLAVATFLGNESLNDAIQGQTKSAVADVQKATFDTQDEVFQVAQALLIVQKDATDTGLKTAAAAALKGLDPIEKQVPAEEKRLSRELKDTKAEVKASNDKHLLYEIAEVLLQIAIVLASVSIVADRKFLLRGSHGVAVGGAAVLFVGYMS
jgi:Domain of unknown function (DUF4337)